MADPTEAPVDAGASMEMEDEFGRPHAQQVSDTLQMWVLAPGLVLLLVFVGEEDGTVYQCLNEVTGSLALDYIILEVVGPFPPVASQEGFSPASLVSFPQEKASN